MNIFCCEYFKEFAGRFHWFNFTDEKRGKIYCMPSIDSFKDDRMWRVNHCPSCGKEIRSIELTEEEFNELL
jgi:hypothetical protein